MNYLATKFGFVKYQLFPESVYYSRHWYDSFNNVNNGTLLDITAQISYVCENGFDIRVIYWQNAMKRRTVYNAHFHKNYTRITFHLFGLSYYIRAWLSACTSVVSLCVYVCVCVCVWKE